MKSLVLLIATVCISLTASAALFDCGVPHNSSGKAAGDGLAYQVHYATNGMIYLVTENTATHQSTSSVMKTTYSAPHSTKLQSGSVEAVLENKSMTLSQDEDFEAICKLDPSVEQDAQSMNLVCTNQYLANPFFSCEDLQP